MTDDFIIRRLVLAVVVFTLIISAGMFYINEASKVDSTILVASNVSQFNKSLNQYDKVNTEISGLKTKLIDRANSNFNFFNVVAYVVVTLWEGIKGIFTSFSFSFDFITTGFGFFGLGGSTFGWFSGLLVMGLTVLLIFAVVSFVIGRNT